MTNLFRRGIVFSMIGALLVLSLCSCNSRDDDYDNYDYDDYYDDDYWADLEEEYVKNAVVYALLDALEQGRIINPKSSYYRALNDDICAGECSFDIASTEGDSDSGWIVKGRLTLYDEFGNICYAFASRDCYDYKLNFIVEVSRFYQGECTYLDVD